MESHPHVLRRSPRFPALRTATFFVFALLGFMASCRRHEPPSLATPPVAEPNFVILVIDALRADHLGSFGYARDTSPTLDRLAARGVLFTQTTSPSSYTLASVPSIFTGLLPDAHGVLRQGRKHSDVLADRFLTVAEFLKSRGYATAAFMPNPSLNRKFHFDQGFDLYQDEVIVQGKGLTKSEVYETARKIHRGALEWLDGRAGEKFFLYLHYRDVHGPYVPPPPYHRRYWKPEDAAAPGVRLLGAEDYERMPPYLRHKRDYGVLEYYLAQYDGEIRYTDERIAEFLAELERRGLLEHTILFVTADHGEAFLEHGQWNHGKDLYEEELHVPLILVNPAVTDGRRVAAPVQTIDLFPTILDYLDAPVPEELQGRSLLETAAQPPPARALFSQGRDHEVVRRGSWKLVRHRASGALELYDLAGDPREQQNLAGEKSEKARRLAGELERIGVRNAKLHEAGASQQAVLDEADVADLKALGYVE